MKESRLITTSGIKTTALEKRLYGFFKRPVDRGNKPHLPHQSETNMEKLPSPQSISTMQEVHDTSVSSVEIDEIDGWVPPFSETDGIEITDDLFKRESQFNNVTSLENELNDLMMTKWKNREYELVDGNVFLINKQRSTLFSRKDPTSYYISRLPDVRRYTDLRQNILFSTDEKSKNNQTTQIIPNLEKTELTFFPQPEGNPSLHTYFQDTEVSRFDIKLYGEFKNIMANIIDIEVFKPITTKYNELQAIHPYINYINVSISLKDDWKIAFTFPKDQTKNYYPRYILKDKYIPQPYIYEYDSLRNGFSLEDDSPITITEEQFHEVVEKLAQLSSPKNLPTVK